MGAPQAASIEPGVPTRPGIVAINKLSQSDSAMGESCRLNRPNLDWTYRPGAVAHVVLSGCATYPSWSRLKQKAIGRREARAGAAFAHDQRQTEDASEVEPGFSALCAEAWGRDLRESMHRRCPPSKQPLALESNRVKSP